MVGKHLATSRKARRHDRHLAPCKRIREIFYCGIRNPVKFCLWNPESWVLEFGIPNTQRGIQSPRLIIILTIPTCIDISPPEFAITCIDEELFSSCSF